MSDAKSKKKKKQQKMSFAEFQKQSGGPAGKSMLPSAPGELPSGPGQGGRYNRGGDRRGGGRYGDRPQSAADSSNQWRRDSSRGGDRPPRRSYNDRGGDRGGDRGSRYGDRDRSERREPESRYDDSFSRNMFGSKKQTSSTRISSVGRDSFGSGRTSTRISSNRDDDLSIDRSSFGKKTPLRPVNSRNFDRGSSGFGGRRDDFGSSGGYGSGPSSRGPIKRGFFDGSGSGFGAHLVADLFATDSSGPAPRVNYAFDSPKKTGASRFAREPEPVQPTRDRLAPWGKATSAPRNQKTPEQIAEEEAEKREREEAAKAERSARDAERQRKVDEREAKERRKAAEKAAKEEMKAHLASLREDVEAMLAGDPRILTREHLEVVMPEIEPSQDEAETLGTALAMTVNQETVALNEAVHMIPASNFDITFINMLSALATRMGEMDFIAEIQNQSIDVFALLQDKNDIEGRLLDANLKCLVGNDETQSQLEDAFASHVDLYKLYDIVRDIEDFPAEMIPKVTAYIFDEYFTNQNTDDPATWFATGDIFVFLEEKLGGHTEIIDIAIQSWHAHGANPSALVPMFDKLLRSTYIYADQMSIWNADYEATDSKMSAMMAEIDEDGRSFGEWMMDVEIEYALEEEEEDYDDDGMQYM